MTRNLLFTILLALPIYLLGQSYATFSQVGPVKFPNNPSVQTTGMGRVSQMVYHPQDSNTLFAVTASGGIFKSSNEGTTWRPISDYLPQTSCASLAINAINPKTMFLGTGDANYNGGGLGAWKTIDGGNSWFQSSTGIGNRLVSYILYSPNDSATLIAACSDGIYKSTDAGSNWVKKTTVAASYRSICYRPGSNKIIYAATDANFYRSYDNGDSWIQSTVNSAITCAGIKIAVCPSDTSKLYCVVWKSGAASPFGGVYKSTNNGVAFTLQADTPNILGYSGNGSSMDGQGSYNLDIAADPDNSSTLYIVGINVWKSADQGATFNLKSHWAFGVHADKHGIVFSPFNHKKMFIIHDGGLDRSTDGGTTWTTLEDGLSASEFYKMGSSGLYNDHIIGGLQDNGLDIAVNKKFSTVRGGDWGGDFAFDAFDSSLLYENGGLKRNIVSNSTNGINGKGGIYLVHPNDSNVLFEATTNLFRTNNLRANPSSNVTWNQISNLSGNNGPKALAYSKSSSGTLYLAFNTQSLYISNDINSTNPTFTKITTFSFNAGEQIKQIETCDYDSNVLYVLTSQSRLLRSNNKGATWTSLNKNLPSFTIIKFLTDQKSQDSSMYACNAFGVYYRNKFMKNWINFSQGLPTVAQISDMEIMSAGNSKSRLHIATYGRGIWQTNLYSSTTLAPIADFIIQSTSSQSCPNNVMLVDNSIYSPTYRKWQISPAKGWSFINGTDSFSPRAELQFNTAGVYSVTLIVSNSKGLNIKTNNYNYSSLPVNATCYTTTTNLGGYGIGINRFELNGIDKSSGTGNQSYEDFSCNNSAILKAGGTYTAWVTSGLSYNENVKLYIDYNNNGVFTDANELLGSISNGQGRRSIIFTTLANPPLTGKFLRMRVVSDYTNVTAPCGVLSYGQSEDYAVFIDRTKPLVTIKIPKPSASNSFTAIFRLSEVANGFDSKDISAVNAVLSNFIQTDALTYSAKITPVNNGIVKLSVSSNSFSDFAGNFNNLTEDSTLFFLGFKSFSFSGISVRDSILQTPAGGVITCNIPYGSSIDSLIATFALSDTSFAYIGGVLQISASTKNNFKNLVTYTIKSKDGLISKSYTVRVKFNKNTDCKLLTFGLVNPFSNGIISQNSTGGTVNITVPFGTSPANLIAWFTLSDSAKATVNSVTQISGITPNNFSFQVQYIITAQDSSFNKIYLVNLTVGKSTSCDLISFAILAPAVNGNITSTGTSGGNVQATMPIRTSLSNLTALFKLSDSAQVYIGKLKQQSGITSNNFSNTLNYKVIAQDTNYAKSYQVTLIVTADTAAELLSYSLVSHSDTGVITNTSFGGYVNLNVPFTTDLNNMVAKFTLSESAKGYVNGVFQQSGITGNNFSDTVVMKIIAQNNIRFKNYFISVSKKTGTAIILKEGKLKIYPNPSNEFIKITSEDATLDMIQIVTITGEQMFLSYPNQKDAQINCTDWSNGVYLLKYTINGLTRQVRIAVVH